MITVHHLEQSRSHRVLWLLEELDLPYEIKTYRRHPATMLAPPELRAVHPLGKSPVITDGGLTLAESGAITEYLIDRYGGGRLKPETGTEEYLRYIYWLHYAEGSAMPPLLMKLIFDRLPLGVAAPMRPIVRMVGDRVKARYVMPQLALHLDYMEGELKKTAWFAGGLFSGADIQMSYPLEAARARAGLDAKRPKLMDFLYRIQDRPAYQRARERGGM
jgi:glutathione S-transferase